MESYKKMLQNAGYEDVKVDVSSNVFTCTRDGHEHLFKLDNEGNIEGHKILVKEDGTKKTYLDIFNKRVTTFDTDGYTLVASSIEGENLQINGENGIKELVLTLEELGLI